MLFRRKKLAVAPAVQEHRETLEQLERVAKVATCVKASCIGCSAALYCVRRRAKEHTYN